MKYIFEKVAMLTLICFLSACKEESQDYSSENTRPSETFVQATPALYSVSSESGFLNIETNIIGSQDAELIELLALENHSHCSASILQNFNFEYAIAHTSNNTKVCDYIYTISTPNGTQQELVRVFLTAAENPILAPINENVTIGESISILPPPGSLIDSITSVSGIDDTLVYISDDSHSVKLKADVTESTIVEIEYLAVDVNDTNKLRLGLMSVVINEHSNSDFVANPGFVEIIRKQPSVPNTIDVRQFVSGEGQDYQLFGVSSLSGTAVSSNSDDLFNTSFDFFGTFGTHYIQYSIYDHNQNYSANVIELELLVPDQTHPWKDIDVGIDTYTAPVTLSEAIEIMIGTASVSSTAEDDMYLATFTHNKLGEFCGYYGRRPTLAELQNLVAADAADVHGWPILRPYMSSNLSESGNPLGVYLDTGEVVEFSNSTIGVTGYGTCKVHDILNLKVDKSTAIANSNEEVEVTVTLNDMGSPIVGELITAQANGNANVSPSSGHTNSQGEVKFFVTNTAVESTRIDFSSLEDTRSAFFNFIADESSAEVRLLEVTINNAEANGTDENRVRASVEDDYSNPVGGVEVSFWTSDAHLQRYDRVTDVNGKAIFNDTFQGTRDDAATVDITARVRFGGTLSEKVTVSFTGRQPHPVITTHDNGTRYMLPPFETDEIIELIDAGVNVPMYQSTISFDDDAAGPANKTYGIYNFNNAVQFCRELVFEGHSDWTIYGSEQPDHFAEQLHNMWIYWAWPGELGYWFSSAARPGFAINGNLMSQTKHSEPHQTELLVTCGREI
ncbi:Ig-like domain-containing protein [Vibrio sp. 1CM2L]|uniref:Ig-like domain-containing protein n=1 Tax=Vibrio sp. 1CM2L TaxID=2929166 RepID=UPI0020BE3415|nr:Ig-like domain-containing protein [Vibrio sp. 1CM2L]MCK8075879.1 Ig-like domain-containing protein [Vibrio sp. 1CM2L]